MNVHKGILFMLIGKILTNYVKYGIMTLCLKKEVKSMNKDEMQYKLQTEGINGLRLKSRPQQEIVIDKQTGKKIPVLVDRGADDQTRKNDLRSYTAMGVIKPSEDYWIEGEGRTPLGIREVRTSISGRKKYALLEEVCPQEKNSKKTKKRGNDKTKRISGLEDIVQYNARFVYSEGIDFKLMAEDEEYAKQVMKLFQEKRLKQKQDQSNELGLDVVYLGTIAKVENEYTIAGIKDYAKAAADIAFKIEECNQIVKSKINAERKEQESEEMKGKIKELIQSLEPAGCKEVLRQLFGKFGIKEMYDMLKGLVAEIKNDSEKQEQSGGNGAQPNSEDEQWVCK
jgi:hypothetical protein